jgi:hypothetical protein
VGHVRLAVARDYSDVSLQREAILAAGGIRRIADQCGASGVKIRKTHVFRRLSMPHVKKKGAFS